MQSETLNQLFASRRPTDPSTLLLEMPGGARLTYGEADRHSAQLANALHMRGVRPGDRVAVQLEKSPLGVLLYLACLRSGAALLPMNPAFTEDEVAFLLHDAEPSVLITDDSIAAEASELPDTYADVVPQPDDLAAIVYTSGTTGRPKGAMLSQRNLASNAATLHEIWGFRSDDVLLHALPIFHVHGLFVALNCVLANGTGMVFLPRFEVDAVLGQLPRCTVLMGVPTFYTRLLADARFDTEVCAKMRLFISGSAPLLAATHDEFRRRTGHAILERYGMTETGMLTSNPLDGERRAGTVGPPLPGVDVRVIDAENGVGSVEVRGSNVFGGYWRRPELATTDFTDDGFFRTGDMGSFDDSYLTIVGRAKDLVISGGLNVYPKEVEDVLDDFDGVLESAVVGVPDHDLGEKVVAVVVPEAGATLDIEELRQAARDRLAGYKVPKSLHLVDALPRNTMGKVQKNVLRQQLSRN